MPEDLESHLRTIETAVANIRSLAPAPPDPDDPDAPDPTPTPEPEPPRAHVVAAGETLSRIAALYPPLTWQRLAEYNGVVEPYTITPGQVLRLVAPNVDVPPDTDPIELLLTVTAVDADSVRVAWAVNATAERAVTGFVVARDGTDTTGSGAWETELPADARDHTFNELRAGDAYTFTVREVASNETASVTYTVPATSTPTPTPDPTPSPGTGDTAAARLNWGAPTWSDDFSQGLSAEKWQNSPVGGMDGHGGNGRRIASSAYVRDGVLQLHGKSNGDTAWLRQRLHTTYGRWELRFRSRNVGSSGGLYHVLALIWPSNEQWPAGGEYDWLENMSPDQSKIGAFLHYPHPRMPVEQEYREFTGVRTGEWNTVAFEWTKDHLKGWVNGRDWYTVSGGANSRRSNVQAMPKGVLTLQLDNFTGDGGLREALYEVDYVNFWRV